MYTIYIIAKYPIQPIEFVRLGSNNNKKKFDFQKNIFFKLNRRTFSDDKTTKGNI